jgi:hypothetical protein
MTPKEKAKELVCKMYGCEINTDLNDIYILNEDGYFLAKDCALDAVDFAMEFITGNLDEAFDKTLYLLEVKKEIEKL